MASSLYILINDVAFVDFDFRVDKGHRVAQKTKVIARAISSSYALGIVMSMYVRLFVRLPHNLKTA